MVTGDLDRVVAIHFGRFPDSRSTSLGRPFVKRMYQWFIRYEPDLALISEIDGQVEGFIVGSRGGYGRRVFQYALPQVIWGLARNPALLRRRKTFTLWRSYARALFPGGTKTKSDAVESASPRVSVASIAVSPAHAGEGLFLMLALEKQAKKLGAQTLSASVESYNERLISLHLRLGWVVHRKNASYVALRKSFAVQDGGGRREEAPQAGSVSQ